MVDVGYFVMSYSNSLFRFFPTYEKCKGNQWDEVNHETLRKSWKHPIEESRIKQILEPYAEQFKQYPLYITLDKDCMIKPDNHQNWNSGNLTRKETLLIVKVLLEMCGGNLLAMDVTGEFTPVELVGTYRHHLHKQQHEEKCNNQDPDLASQTNQETNMELLQLLVDTLN
eukprot:TRINITY_DN1832_c0_g1_i7.p1 TRINITY_DN1832_c0_g1~~TRINITY_DN1832_c0_g1_i7.p1  ORF type:complete len:170 (+),score=24.62 TRINITY_DN1832_c0_g1_i7:669-1178(+)